MQRLPQRRRAPRDHLRPRHDRGDQPRRPDLRPHARRAGRRGPDHGAWSTTPTSCPGRCSARRTARGSRVVPINDARRAARSTSSSGCSTPRTKLVAVAHVSNALGTVNPVSAIIAMAHAPRHPGASSTARRRCRTCRSTCRTLDCDFYAFSGHKLYGPTGIGVLYGKAALLEAMPPYQGGGDMIRSVTFEKTTYNVLPYKFEAGTPQHRRRDRPRRGDRLRRAASACERSPRTSSDLLAYATERLSRDSRACASIGTAPREGRRALVRRSTASTRTTSAPCSTSEGIAIRTGHHCAQPVMERFGVPATARASLRASTTRATRSTRWSRRFAKVTRMFG